MSKHLITCKIELTDGELEAFESALDDYDYTKRELMGAALSQFLIEGGYLDDMSEVELMLSDMDNEREDLLYLNTLTGEYDDPRAEFDSYEWLNDFDEY